jgi:hypothetical protein
MRGGGVGFFVKNTINFSILDDLSPFENKIIEVITIKITYSNKLSFILSSMYRSNGPLPNVTPAQQLTRFLDKFDNLTAKLERTNDTCFIFCDSNIDALKIGITAQTNNYFDIIFANGFLQTNLKATRIQGQSSTLIDQILTNSKKNHFTTFTIISDISDHFFTAISPLIHEKKQIHKKVTRRLINEQIT